MTVRYRLRPVTWLLIASLVIQCVAPALGSNQDELRGLYDRYRASYDDYRLAVTAGADLPIVQQKLDTYYAARGAYQRALEVLDPSASKGQSAAEAGRVPASEREAAAAPEPATADPASGPATIDPAPGSPSQPPVREGSPGSWFSKAFKTCKEALFGKAGEKKMPLVERVLWNVGRALLPSFAVVMVTALLAPLSPVAMIIGGVVMGAAASGMLTYAYEKRMNARYRDTPLEEAKIWRNVSVAAVTQGVMAPFNMATGGLFGMAGPVVGKAVVRVALAKAAIGMAGAVVSSAVGGAVKQAWAKHYFHYPEKIASNQARINQILSAHLADDQPLSEADAAELTRLRKDIDAMKAESYSAKDFGRDVKRAAVSNAISGFAGTLFSSTLYDYSAGRWADRVSVKLFDSVKNGRAISDLFTSMPIDYLSGMSGGAMSKHFISEDIRELQANQNAWPPGSAPHQYYGNLIAMKQQQRDEVNLWRAGLDQMVNNLANRSAQLGVQALKHNLIDAPRARKEAIERQYHEQDPDWQKANARFAEYQKLTGSPPKRSDFSSKAAWQRAVDRHQAEVNSAKAAWVAAAARARQLDDDPAKQQLRAEIAVKHDELTKLNQMVELGRLQGGFAHLRAVKELIKAQRPELANASDQELDQLAVATIKESYVRKFEDLDNRVKATDDLFKKHADYKAGKLQLSPDEAKRLEGQVAMISPSQYRAMWVERRVYQLKTENQRWNQVRDEMPRILAEAEAVNLQRYGNSWNRLLTAEIYANGLAQYKYDPSGRVDFIKEARGLLTKAPTLAKTAFINDFNSQLNTAIAANVLPNATSTGSPVDDYLQKMASSTGGAISRELLDAILAAPGQKIQSAFAR